MTIPCRAVGRFVESFLDGELDPSQVLEVEKHTQTCGTCRERVALDGAIRAEVKGVVTRAKPSANFRARVADSMTAQRWAAESASSPGVLSTWGAWVVGAAAAVAAVVGFQGRTRNQETDSSATVRQASVAAPVGLDAMIDQFVDWHARPLPPEITNPQDLPGFEPYVGVPVHPPALARIGARLLGGRILPVQQQHVAAMLQYTLDGGHRISVYVYDPRRLETPPSRLRTKVIGTEPVYVGRVRGWSIAAAERRGVGYAVASDLDDDESAELALAAAP
jgi:anti-sigma factor RsiW